MDLRSNAKHGDLQSFTESMETNAKNGVVLLATSNVKLFLDTIWSG